MQKVPSLLLPDMSVNPEAEWVLEGKGTATVQYDGLSYAIIKGQPYIHTVTPEFTPDLILCSVYDNLLWGWKPVSPDDEIFWPVWESYQEENWDDWSYEIVGPGIEGNHEQWPTRTMIPHGRLEIQAMKFPTVAGIKSYLTARPIEGIVWWRDMWDWGCRKAKVQQSDFGFIRAARPKK